ncbi:MAG: pyridoxamine 5'-phosphate oxidase family protein [Defluviitaleaceae bacterium]|nr:pyridoxamine 5'-phosphate oxidase family protein [Defluviitaleaceae bacterium]
MFKEMRRNDRALPDGEMFDIMDKAEYGVLSTVGSDGCPYGVPVNFVFFDNCIYFHCALEGHKLENMNYNSKVSFCVVTDVLILPDEFSTKYSSVISFGTASEVTEPAKKKEVFVKILEKFSKDFMEEGIKYAEAACLRTKIYQIKVLHMTAKGRR